jgi:hypothetical protein
LKKHINASYNLFALSLITGPNGTSNGSLGIESRIASFMVIEEEEEEEMRDRVVVGYNSIKYLLILIIFILLVIPLIIIDETYFTANDVGNV